MSKKPSKMTILLKKRSNLREKDANNYRRNQFKPISRLHNHDAIGTFPQTFLSIEWRS